MSSLEISAIGDFASGPIPGVEFQKLADADHALPAPPRFTFGPVPELLMTSYYNAWGIGSVGIFRLQGFELSGAFLLSLGDTYYRCPQLNVHPAHIEAEVERVQPFLQDAKRRHLKGRHVVLAGPGYRVYGHWLAEYLPKIGLLNLASYATHSLNYLLPSDTPGFVLAWLALLGIGPDQIVSYDKATDIISADELLLPTILHNGPRMSPLFKNSADFLRGLIALKHDLGGSAFGPRIFLSRGKGKYGRCLENRERLEGLAAEAKFTVVQPETLSLVDQVRLFVGAREIMGEYGSALHGSMFSPERTVVCALRSTGGHPGFIQSGIGAVMKHPTGYVFGEVDKNDLHANAGFRVEEDAVSNAIKLVFGGLRI